MHRRAAHFGGQRTSTKRCLAGGKGHYCSTRLRAPSSFKSRKASAGERGCYPSGRTLLRDHTPPEVVTKITTKKALSSGLPISPITSVAVRLSIQVGAVVSGRVLAIIISGGVAALTVAPIKASGTHY